MPCPIKKHTSLDARFVRRDGAMFAIVGWIPMCIARTTVRATVHRLIPVISIIFCGFLDLKGPGRNFVFAVGSCDANGARGTQDFCFKSPSSSLFPRIVPNPFSVFF
jgi:hypothetical protein